MNTYQDSYLKARAIVDELTARKSAEMEPHAHLLDTEAGIAEYVDLEMAAEARLHLDTAHKLLRSAEGVLIRWALSTVPDLPELLPLRDNWQRMPNIKARLIDMCMRLAA